MAAFLDDRLVSVLVDPDTHQPLRAHRISKPRDPACWELVSPTGRQYPVRDGIPRFVEDTLADETRDAESWEFKWRQKGSYDSAAMRSSVGAWLLHRYGFESAVAMRAAFERHGRVIDLGCGSGFSTSLWMDSWAGDLYVGVDISGAVDVAKERLGGRGRTAFVQADILRLPFPDESFSAAISEGVFHHTPSTQTAIRSAARILKRGGELMFYVYRRKGPVREFSDDLVRDALASMSPGEAWATMRPLTRLGQALAELDATVEVAEDIPILGIPAGRYDVQRLVYWHFAKLFWNSDYAFEENVHINFDWYRPRFAQRQSEDETRLWCEEAGLDITHFDRDPSGFTVRAIKR